MDEKYIIFFVDDNSNDGSLLKLEKLKASNNNIKFHIRKKYKRDLTKSILEALDYIDTEYVLIMDCDLQHDLNAINKMIKLIKYESYDLVIGSRKINEIKSFKRRYISFIGIWVTKIIGIPKLIDPLSGFFIIKTSDFKEVQHRIISSGYKILLSLIFNLNKQVKIKEVVINFYPRKHEKSKLNFKVIFLFITQIITLLFLNIFRVR